LGEHFEKSINHIANVTLKSAIEAPDFEHRANSFETLGFDFGVDTNLNLWLLDVNRNPDLQPHGFKAKQRLVKEYFESLASLLYNYDYKAVCKKKVTQQGKLKVFME